MEWGKPAAEQGEQGEGEPVVEKEKPNFGLSGALAMDEKTGNMLRGVLLKFSEPPEARMPTHRWRLYEYKGGKEESVLHLHRQSAYLVGKEKRVADVYLRHPSISSQHAVLQYRLISKRSATGAFSGAVKPYLMDLNSTNGTFLNNKRMEPQRFYELLSTDVIKFGGSSREYVVINTGDKVRRKAV